MLDSFTLRNLCLASTGSSNMATNLLNFKQRSPEFYSLLLDCLLYLHFIFRAFRVRSCLLLLKLQFLPFTLVLQIPNLRLFLIQYGLRSPFVSQIILFTEGFPRFSMCNVRRCLTCHHISCESTITSSINGKRYGINIDKDTD